jgi:transcriptional regulator with XRE-family HTH domain
MAGQRTGRRNSAIAERFGRNLLKARRDAGLSQEALATLCSLHRTEIGYLEGGKRVPRLDTAIRLATALEVPLDDFTEGIEWVRGERSAGGFLVRPPGAVIPANSSQGKPKSQWSQKAKTRQKSKSSRQEIRRQPKPYAT